MGNRALTGGERSIILLSFGWAPEAKCNRQNRNATVQHIVPDESVISTCRNEGKCSVSWSVE